MFLMKDKKNENYAIQNQCSCPLVNNTRNNINCALISSRSISQTYFQPDCFEQRTK